MLNRGQCDLLLKVLAEAGKAFRSHAYRGMAVEIYSVIAEKYADAGFDVSEL
jgi:hypothetical protein